jgi:hypothetical protein
MDIPKEKIMSLTQAQLNAFVSLAGVGRDEFTAMEQTMAGLPDEIRAALNEIDSDSKKEAAKVTAKVIFQAFKTADEKVLLQVEEIRAARRREAVAQEAIKQLQNAKAYASETGNYLPLLVLTGEIGTYSAMAELKAKGVVVEVPANWQPKTAPVKAAVKRKTQ